MVEVVPIAVTAIDWNLYLKTASQLLARSVTQELDNRGMKVGDLGSFICTLGELISQGVNPLDSLRDGRSLLDHAHCTFMVLATMPVTMELMQETRLAFTSTETTHTEILVSLASGTLKEWRDAVINCAVDRATTNMRMFANKTITLLEKLGLGQVFSRFNRITMPDRTYRLVET